MALLAILRFVVLLAERGWGRAAAEVSLVIFWVAIAERYCADIERNPVSTAEDD